MKGSKSGFAMTYAVALFLIVTLFVSAMLLYARLTVESSSDYLDYIDDKNLLDEVGAAAIANYTGGNTDGEWADGFENEDLAVDVDFTDGGVRVSVSLRSTKGLYIEFAETFGGYIPVAYVYDFAD